MSAAVDYRDPRIRAAQIQTVYRHLPVVLAANIMVSAFTLFVVWGKVPEWIAITWCALIYIITSARIYDTWLYWKEPRLRERLDLWERRFLLGTIVSGAVWGSGGVWLFVPANIEMQAFLAVVLLGMGAGAIASLSASPPAFYSYFTLLLFPLIIHLFLSGGLVREAMAAMGLVFYVIYSIFARNINKTLLESLKLRYQNIELVESLTREKEAAERANIAKSKFLAAASHDLRQPLHALSLFATALGDRIRYPEVRKIVDNIGASVQALESLFNAMLDISRLDSGVLQPDVEDFRLKTLFDRIENDYRPQAEEKGLLLHIESCGEAIVRSDKTLLEGLLRNLVSNAIRYTDQGGVSVRSSTAGAECVIEVRDTGVGVPQESLDDIFNEYVQLDNPERNRRKGLGLGLAIVSRIGRLLAHPIRVDSVVGKGSIFAVTVPRGQAAGVKEHTEVPMPAVGQELRGMHVLVIDDDLTIQEAVQVLLEGWGCSVAMAGSLEEACASVGAGLPLPDGILADYRLGKGGTGVQAIHAIEALVGAPIPAILITGDMAADGLRDVHTSDYRVMHKPVKPAHLRAFLKHAQKQKQQSRQGVQ